MGNVFYLYFLVFSIAFKFQHINKGIIFQLWHLGYMNDSFSYIVLTYLFTSFKITSGNKNELFIMYNVCTYFIK